MAPNRNQKPSDFGQVEGQHSGGLERLKVGNMINLDDFPGELTGELFGTFTVYSRSMFTGTFNGESINCSNRKFGGSVEGRFVGYFCGSIRRDIQDTYRLGGGFFGKLTGKVFGRLDKLSNEQSTTRNAVAQTNYPPSTVYFLPSRSIILNPSDKKGVVSGKLYGEMRIDRETFDGVVQPINNDETTLQLDNLKGTFTICCLAKFSGTFNEKEYVEAIRTFNGTVHNGLFNGKLIGFDESEFRRRKVYLSGTFSGNLVGNFVGNLDGVVSHRAVTV